MKRPKRVVLVVVVGILILGLAGDSALAQKKKEELRRERPERVLSSNVLALSQGVINLEYETAPVGVMGFYIAPELAFTGGATFFALTLGVKKYSRDTGPEGFWWGPSVSYTTRIVMGQSLGGGGAGLNVGYKTIMDRLTIELRLSYVYLWGLPPGGYGRAEGLLYGANLGYAF